MVVDVETAAAVAKVEINADLQKLKAEVVVFLNKERMIGLFLLILVYTKTYRSQYNHLKNIQTIRSTRI